MCVFSSPGSFGSPVRSLLNGLEPNRPSLGRVFCQQFLGTILLMVFDLQGKSNIPLEHSP